MTIDSIGLDELADSHVDAEGVRRDYLDRYLCRPPGSTKLVAHRRMTTVLKALDSEGGLLPWHGGRVALGMVRDPALLAKARKLLRRGEHDAWYASPGDKAAFKALLAELAEVGGNKDRAKIGTNLHGVAERRLRDGEQPAVIEAALWLDNYVESLRIAGIEIDPNYLEVIVVRDGDRIAGKVDYLRVTVPGYPLPMIGDLKTGDTLDYSLRGYVIQLAGYRFADSIYVQGAADDGSDDERRPLPELDEHRGLIIHAPAGGGPVAFHVVDLDAGREALQLALAVEAWRKRTDLAVELDNGQLAAQLQASLDAINKPSKSVAGRTGVARPPAEGRCAPQDEPGLPRSASGLERPPQRQRATNGAELRAWLQGRINVIGRHEAARSSLQRRWPAGVAPLARQEMHTDDELAEIERCLDRVEAMHSIPFGPNRPYAEQAALGWITSAFPGSTVMDEPNSPTNTHTQEQTS